MGMKPGQFVQHFAEVLRLHPGTGTVLHREFRNAGLISTGSRGRHAPDATARDAARLTIGVLSASRPSEMVDGYRFYSTHQPDLAAPTRDDEDSLDVFSFFGLSKDHTLEDVLTAIYGMWGDCELLRRFDARAEVAVPLNVDGYQEQVRIMPGIFMTCRESMRTVKLSFHNSSVLYHDRSFWDRLEEADRSFKAASADGSTEEMTRALGQWGDHLRSGFYGRGLRIQRSISDREISDIAAAIYGCADRRAEEGAD